MDRRQFILTGASIVAASLFDLSSIPAAFAQKACRTDPVSNPSIAIIIDDIGHSLSRAEQFLRLDVPITFSILPRLVNSDTLGKKIDKNGHDIMLHQPMEPYSMHSDPGPGALYVGHTTHMIASIMEKNIADMPLAIGVNNHMGSRFTSCPHKIKDALEVIRDRRLFFIDSLTSSRSIGFKIAKSIHMTTGYRNIFLDNVPDESAILLQLCKLENHARRSGTAIGIGHPFPQTATAINRFARTLSSDISLVHISDILYA